MTARKRSPWSLKGFEFDRDLTTKEDREFCKSHFDVHHRAWVDGRI